MKKIDIIDEVYTEKQRRWACYQMDAPKSEREISKKNATEMCKDVKHSKKKNEIVKPKMKKKDLVEYINTKISLKEEGENDGDIELLQSQLESINYLLDNKNKVRDILIRETMTRLENRGEEDPDLSKVQRVFESLAKECFKM
jgi:hypothetical protein